MGQPLSQAIRIASVGRESLQIWWLGQAGFAVKTHAGKLLYLDPYLSDSVERLAGFRRLSPIAIEPEEVEADAVLVTHHHEDHLDIDTLPVIARNTNARFVAPPRGVAVLRELGLEASRVEVALPENPVDLGFCVAHPVFADHGELAPDAVGYVVDFGSSRIYFTGDTAYRPQSMAGAFALEPDIVVPVINGAYGNMDAHDAACLVRDSRAREAIPCHFWTFIEHGGDPAAFARECAEHCPDATVVWITQGRAFIHEARFPR